MFGLAKRASLKAIKCERGQANAEYLIATLLVLVTTVALFGIVEHFASSGEGAKTFSRAPYTLPYQGSGSEQWLKDIILH
ncbi:MAG: hypothetical protein FWD93_01565 [Coriobacteriia bacterium]|nr:hypothetical protein [Coriobacteriia bacterium]